MANEFNAKGRRMVFEEDIKKIGQGGGSEYTAGNGIDITNNEISVDETEIQGKLTAGSGISIDNDVISATGGSGASFTDWLDFGDSERYTITADEYNQLKNGEKRLRYRGAIYEVTQIVLEPDWSGFTGLVLEISAPGINKIDTYGQGEAKVGKFHIGINGPDMQDPYAVSYNQDPLVAANTGETPSYTLSTLRVGDNIYSVGGGSSETTYGSKELLDDSWDNLVQAGMTVLTSASIDNGTEFIIDGVVGLEYQQYKVLLYNATSHSNAFTTHKFGQPIRMRKTNNNAYKIVDGYLNTVISPSTLTDVTEEHAFTNSEGSSVTYQTNAAGALFNPVFITVQRDAIALNTRYLDASATERKVHTMLDIPRTTAGDYVLSCSTDGSNITEFGWKTPQGGGTTVSGVNDGTNWTSITIGSDTYGIPSGGGSSYTAGTGIDISNNVVSIDNSVVPKKNTANTFTSTQAIILDTTSHTAASASHEPTIEVIANKGYSSSAKAKLALNYYISGTKYNAGEISISTSNQLRVTNNNTSNGNASMYFGQNTSDGLASRALSISNTDIKILNNGKTLTFPEKAGTLALRSDITNTIPECPTTSDGTYVLEATVSSGAVVYNWVLKQ